MTLKLEDRRQKKKFGLESTRRENENLIDDNNIGF